jgi:hypothetical protein
MKKINGLIIAAALAFGSHVSAQQVVGLAYDFVVSNPAGVVAALDKFVASPTGRSVNGYPILNQYIVNGESLATHNIVVVYPSPEAMDAAFAANAVSQDWATFLAEMAEVSSPVGELMFTSTGVNFGSPDNVSSANAMSQWFALTVTDPAAYVDAWTDLAEEYQSDSTNSSLFAINADGQGGVTHLNVITGNNMTALSTDPLAESRGWGRFVSKVSDIRTVVNRSVVMQVKNYSPTM